MTTPIYCIQELCKRAGISYEALIAKPGPASRVMEQLELANGQDVNSQVIAEALRDVSLYPCDDANYLMRLLSEPRRFHAYNVGISKTGTHSIAYIFSEFRSVAEFENNEMQLAYSHFAKTRSREFLHSYVRQRDLHGWLEMDSADCNHLFLPVLVKQFPWARFVFTIRDCYSWFDSFINMVTGPRFTSVWFNEPLLDRGLPFVLHRGEGEDKRELRANIYRYMDVILMFYQEANTRILAHLPPDRTLIVKTKQITTSLPQLAEFIEVPLTMLRQDKSHQNQAERKYQVLKSMDYAFVEDRFNAYCSDIMERFFPDYTLREFLDQC